MRPFLEKLPYEEGSSLAVLNRRLDQEIPFQWHHHPEYELTLTLNSFGQRFIGDHVGDYGDGDLVLVGPNLPHTWASQGAVEPGQPHVALVIWFHPDWAIHVTQSFVEFQGIGNLLSGAGRGLVFDANTAQALRSSFDQFFEQTATERVMTLMQMLDHLGRAQTGQPLASSPAQPAGMTAGRDRIDRVLDHIHVNYAQDVRMEDLAAVAALSLSGVHRLFRKHMCCTISEYIRQLRVGDACARLSATDQPIAHIAHEVGYGALANFNRQFRAAKGMTPRQYRAHFQGKGVTRRAPGFPVPVPPAASDQIG